MNIQKKTRALVESSLMVALTCVFGIIGTYIPFLSFLLWFIPVPFIILGKRHGTKLVVLSIVATGIIMASFSDPFYALFVVGFPGVSAIVMGYMIRKEYKGSYVLLGGSIASLIVSVISLTLVANIMGINLADQIAVVFEEAAQIQTKMYEAIGGDRLNIESMSTMLDQMAEMAIKVIPATLILTSVFMSYINYSLATHILRRLKYPIEKLKPFKELRLPKNIFFGSLTILIMAYFVKYLDIVDQEVLLINIFLIFQIVFLIQGFSVLKYFLEYYKVNKGLGIAIMGMIFFSQIGIMILVMIGFSDTMIDYRKYRPGIK